MKYTKDFQKPCGNGTQCKVCLGMIKFAINNTAGPDLYSINVKVCTEEFSGTDDSVKVKLMNGKFGECTTDWLNTAGDDWEAGTINGFDTMLSSCEYFRHSDFRWLVCSSGNVQRGRMGYLPYWDFEI